MFRPIASLPVLASWSGDDLSSLLFFFLLLLLAVKGPDDDDGEDVGRVLPTSSESKTPRGQQLREEGGGRERVACTHWQTTGKLCLPFFSQRVPPEEKLPLLSQPART